MRFTIAIEGRKSLQTIQKDFKNQLSQKQILKTTALALNETARKTIPKLKKEVKQEYTLDRKYLSRLAKLTKPAAGTPSQLYAELSFSYAPTPLIGLKNKDNFPHGVTVEIKRGHNQVLKHAFIASMASGHTGIFGRGRYIGGRFVNDKSRTSTGKGRITEFKTLSPYNMLTKPGIQNRIESNIISILPGRLRALLQQKVDKLTS